MTSPPHRLHNRSRGWWIAVLCAGVAVIIAVIVMIDELQSVAGMIMNDPGPAVVTGDRRMDGHSLPSDGVRQAHPSTSRVHATIAGQVMDLAGGALGGARIEFRSGDAYQSHLRLAATSDSDGRFAVESCPTGRQYEVLAYHRDHGITSTTIGIVLGRQYDLPLTLATKQAAHGSVQDQSGAGIAGVSVSVVVSGKVGGVARPFCRTDSRGLFSLNTSGRTLVVAVEKKGYETVWIPVAPGRDIEVGLRRCVPIRGIVRGPGRNKRVAASLVASEVEHWVPEEITRNSRRGVAVAEDGSFELYVVPRGRWRLVAVSTAGVSSDLSLDVPAREVLDLLIKERPKCRVLVIDESGAPVRDAEIGSYGRETAGGREAENLWWNWSNAELHRARTGADGTAILPVYGKDRGWIGVRAKGFVPVARVFEFLDGETVEFVLERIGSLRVALVDGEPKGIPRQIRLRGVAHGAAEQTLLFPGDKRSENYDIACGSYIASIEVVGTTGRRSPAGRAAIVAPARGRESRVVVGPDSITSFKVPGQTDWEILLDVTQGGQTCDGAIVEWAIEGAEDSSNTGKGWVVCDRYGIARILVASREQIRVRVGDDSDEWSGWLTVRRTRPGASDVRVRADLSSGALSISNRK